MRRQEQTRQRPRRTRLRTTNDHRCLFQLNVSNMASSSLSLARHSVRQRIQRTTPQRACQTHDGTDLTQTGR